MVPKRESVKGAVGVSVRRKEVKGGKGEEEYSSDSDHEERMAGPNDCGWCKKGFSDIRIKAIELQQPYEEDSAQTVGKFLFCEENIENKKSILQQMWMKREKLVKIRNTQN
ncbi:uncharacterized protein [Palaemon carinicauda]|uniref:uncharacterized protein n=1 Tax=Palaemon carinicauda TaxID=392227 RepID=UPI0035B6682F